VKYFHPAFLEREVLWDSATIVAIDRVSNAKSTEEYRVAVSDMLASLSDPVTRVTQKSPPGTILADAPKAGRRWEVIGSDSTLVIALPSLEDFSGAMQSLTSALADVGRASSIVVDLRGPEPDEIGNSAYVFAANANAAFPASSVASPSQRRRMHSGFVPQQGSTSGGYWSGTYEQAGELISVPTPNPSRRIIFLANRAIILDDRGYPQGTAWSIAPRLTDKKTVPAAAFQRPLVMSPDSVEWTTYNFVQHTPPTTMWRYHGKTVLLVDERTISQAEHTGLFFEAANKTLIVGSPTMGANGDVTTVVLPGGLYARFTGHDVRHFDGRQLQRIGLQPDVVVRPTLAGIRAGRDEVLERALEILRK